VKSVKQFAKRMIRAILPLPFRKRLALWLHGQEWLVARSWWTLELIEDWAKSDPDAYHRFVWSHHMGYAVSYEIAQRFGQENIHPSRKLLCQELLSYLALQNNMTSEGIRSVFEVGCSMGYLLRYLEEDIFPAASVFEGIDIDRYAIEAGSRHLESMRSIVRISCTDMVELNAFMQDRTYDLTIAPGVLMYLTENAATDVVRAMLRHTIKLMVVAGLAHPDTDNGNLKKSVIRQSDGAFIHNLDRIVETSGATVVYRRWDGAQNLQGNSIYFLFVVPADSTQASANSSH